MRDQRSLKERKRNPHPIHPGDRKFLAAFYRFMVKQRRIDRDVLASEMGVGRSRIEEILSEGPRTHESQDRLEDAIGRLTSRAGGLLRATGSTQAGLLEFRRIQEEAKARALLGESPGLAVKLA